MSILKDRYGNENERVNVYVKELLDLPYTPTANARKIHEFHERLSYCVQSLISLKQLHTVDGMASMTLEKLPAVRGDLVRDDPEWETWGLAKLTEALKLWTRRNPIESVKTTNQPSKDRDRPSRVFQTQLRRNQRQPKQRCHRNGMQ